MRLPLRRRTVFFFKLAVQEGQHLSVKRIALDMIVALIKNSPNALHRTQKCGRGLGMTLAVIQSGQRDGVLIGIAKPAAIEIVF